MIICTYKAKNMKCTAKNVLEYKTAKYRSYSLLSRTIFSQNFYILNAKPGGVGGCGLKPSFSE